MNDKERAKYLEVKKKFEAVAYDFPTVELNKLFAKSLARQVSKKLQKMERENDGLEIRKDKNGLPFVRGKLAKDTLEALVVVKGYEQEFWLPIGNDAVEAWLLDDNSAYKSRRKFEKALGKESSLKDLLEEVKKDAFTHETKEASGTSKTEEYLKGCVEANEWCSEYANDPDFMSGVLSQYKENLRFVSDDYSETDAKDEAIKQTMELFGIEEDLER